MRSNVPRMQLTPASVQQTRIEGGFWGRRVEKNRTVTLPLEYEINRKNGVLDAYKWDWWDLSQGKPPWKIWVGDIFKWIEAASCSLAVYPDEKLSKLVKDAISKVLAGQKDDGYIYSNAIPREWRFANLQTFHELYEGGHLFEAAAAHYHATGEKRFLEGAKRLADLYCETFGRGEGRIPGYDGHPEVELALVKLYRATGEPRYLELARFFVDERGRQPVYFIKEAENYEKLGIVGFDWYKGGKFHLCQAHKPLREQEDAEGHAVRALYLYSGMADVAAETGDAELFEACKRMWKSVTRRRMYVTGGVGSSPKGEAFTFDYDLPNEEGYAETCANIALVFFSHRMLNIEADSEYADVMERGLYNSVLSGVGQDGKSFFYANHHAVYPRAKQGADNLATTRPGWLSCACCPPNIARLLASLGSYVYSTKPDAAYVHLYVNGSVNFDVDGVNVKLIQQTDYPWKEDATILVEPDSPVSFTLNLRVPGWCRGAKLRVNGKPISLKGIVKRGYAHVTRIWKAGDWVKLTMPMPVERIEANPSVRMDCGKAALQRGPVVYCLEEVDNGRDLADISIPKDAKFTAEYRPRLLGGTVVVRGKAFRRDAKEWKGVLYSQERSPRKEITITAVPYALWANRKPGEMIVWVRGE